MTLKQDQKIPALLDWLNENGLAGFMVPHADDFQGEFISDNNLRLQWLTAFTGSAGTAVVYDDKVHLFVDGRYSLQAPQEVDLNFVEVHHFRDPNAIEWLAAHVQAGEKIGYDPRIHNIANINLLKTSMAEKKVEPVPLDQNPIDQLWGDDRPPPPFAPAYHHDISYSGRSSDDKIVFIAEKLAETDADAIVLNEMDAIAWAFNIRGGDTAHTPLVQSFAIILATAEAHLFADIAKFDQESIDQLGKLTTLQDMPRFADELDQLGQDKSKVSLDKNSSTDWILTRLKKAGAEIIYKEDPTKLGRAIKNDTEIAGAHAAHQRDALAMIRFLKWLDETSRTQSLTEIEVADKLEASRTEHEMFRDLSFATIAGAGPHAAIVHYHATKEGNRELDQNSLLLLDSGAQYPDGTTDITRTLPIGEPTDDMRKHFTLVLKGHIAIATSRFPKGTSGGQMDALARQHLWRAGLNYDHGTGHGVGSYLGVHEGPHRLASGSTVPFEAGMILSNEPGFYLQDNYGIRIENLVVVRESERAENFLEFEQLTVVPIDRRLIDVSLLDDPERQWIDDYHNLVYETARPHLEEDVREWLASMCAPLQQ